MRLCVLIPAHAPWHVIELTVGTFLKHHRSDEIDIHVGVHSNLCDYTKDHRMFEDLRGIAQIHMVDEIDWKNHNESVYRYSTMHAKNLHHLIKHAAYYSFDRLVILDHDLWVKGPFVTEFVAKYPSADLIGAAMNDVSTMKEFTTEKGQVLYSLPKISIWHAILTRKLFDKLMEHPVAIYPRVLNDQERPKYFQAYGAERDLPVFVDTFADVLHRTRFEWELNHQFIPETDFSKKVRHFSGSSFNYGVRLLGERYNGRMSESLELFSKQLPKGLEPFRMKMEIAKRGGHGHRGNKSPHHRKNMGASL